MLTLGAGVMVTGDGGAPTVGVTVTDGVGAELAPGVSGSVAASLAG